MEIINNWIGLDVPIFRVYCFWRLKINNGVTFHTSNMTIKYSWFNNVKHNVDFHVNFF